MAPALGLLAVAVAVCLLSALGQQHGHHATGGPALLSLALRVVATAAAAGVVGCLVLVLFQCRPRRPGPPELDLLRPASGWALVWVAALLAGLALSAVHPSVVAVGPGLPPAAQWRWLVLGAVLAALVRLLCAAVRTRSDVRVLLALALTGVAVATATGHDRPGLSPDTVPLLAHVVAATVWSGGLLALVLHTPVSASGAALVPTVRAYSRLASGCYVLLLTSGVLLLLSRTSPSPLLAGDGYLRVVVVKLSLLVLLGLAGALQRSHAMVRLEEGRSRSFLRLATAELVLMAAALGLGVTLAHSAA